MVLKVKVKKGDYALRVYDKSGKEVYYTSSRIGGIGYESGGSSGGEMLVCEIPDAGMEYELKEIKSGRVLKAGKVKEGQDVQNK